MAMATAGSTTDGGGDGTAAGASSDCETLMWPVAVFWRACGVFLLDLTYNRFSKWFSAALLASGVMNIGITPWSLCVLDGWCEDAMSTTYRQMYTRLVALISLMSRASIVYKVRGHMAEYRRRQEAYERNWPLSTPHRRRYHAYASSVVSVCLALTVPVNAMRLYLFYKYDEYGDNTLLLFFFNMYLQNWSMCCMETHFALLCFGVYLNFRGINDELLAVRADVMVSNRYPVALRSMRPTPAASRSAWRRRRRAKKGNEPCVDDGRPIAGGGGCGAAATAAYPSFLHDPLGCPLETTVEVLRVRHGLMRESVDYLNNMFGCQLTLSLIALCVMILFDIYNEAFYNSGTNSRSKFIYYWMLQYMFRFFVIIMTAHNTTQEGYKTKVLVTEINNRHLNSNTKYELQLFLKQMNHQSIDITACDCFTLNSHLVASAIAVGTTYLFVLIQFHENIS